MKPCCLLPLLLAVGLGPCGATITLGPVSDFQSGTNEGWGGGANPTNISTGGPAGAGDRFLEINGSRRMATFNTSLSGILDPAATAIQVDLRRPLGQSALPIRIVLFGPGTGNRWTSSTAANVLGDGVWRTYQFSLLESDLTQVLGSGSYSDLVGNVNRTMIRHDPDPASADGEGVAGTLQIDNISVVPEASTVVLSSCALLGLLVRRRPRSAGHFS